MGFLGEALLKLGVDRKGLDEGLKGAEKRTEQFGKKAEKSTGRASKGFGKIKSSIVGSSAQIPVFGGLISKVLGAAATGPIGLATAGLVAMGAAVAASVTKIANLEKELRPMIARSGIAGESLQVLAESAKRAGSEDGLEGVTDGSQELQLRLAELVQDGTGPAGAAFDKLGLSGEDLIDKSPEEAFLATVTALQGVTSAADKKFLADELMGGSSEKLSGILNLTSEEFAALTENVRENADIVSNEGLESGRQFNGLMTEMKDVMGKAMTAIGEEFLPIILDLVDAFRDIYPEIKPLIDMMGSTLKTAFQTLASLLKIVAAVLRGDFAGAWREIKLLVLNVVESIIANVESLIEFLPDKFVPDSWEQGVKDARAAINAEMDAMKEDAKAAADDTADAVEDAGGRISESAGDTATAIGDATTSSIRSWTAEQEAAEKRAKTLTKLEKEITDMMLAASNQRFENMKTAYAKQVKAEGERLRAARKFWADIAATEAEYRTSKGKADLEAWGVTEIEYKLAQVKIKNLTNAEYAELLSMAEEFGINDLALLQAHNRNMKIEQIRASREAIDDAEELAGGINETLDKIKTPKLIEIVASIRAGTGGGIGSRPGTYGSGVGSTTIDAEGWRTETTGLHASGQIASSRTTDPQGNTREHTYRERPDDFAAGGIFPPRPGGQLVNLAEGGEPEAILNPSQLADVMGVGGNGQGGGQPMEFLIQLGDETLATVYVEGKRVAVREGRD